LSAIFFVGDEENHERIKRWLVSGFRFKLENFIITRRRGVAYSTVNNS